MLKNDTHATTVSLKKKYRYIILYNIHLCFRRAAQKTDAIDCKRFEKIKSISRSEAWKTFSSVVTKHIEKKYPTCTLCCVHRLLFFLCTRGYTSVSDENNKKRKTLPEHPVRKTVYGCSSTHDSSSPFVWTQSRRVYCPERVVILLLLLP